MLRGKEYSGDAIPDKAQLIEWVKERGENYYHIVCIHRGILDKLKQLHKQSPQEVCDALRKSAKSVIVHSGRVGRSNLPNGVKSIPLSNVVAWINGGLGKREIVDELCLIRRT
jgi:hypothetical protein